MIAQPDNRPQDELPKDSPLTGVSEPLENTTDVNAEADAARADARQTTDDAPERNRSYGSGEVVCKS